MAGVEGDGGGGGDGEGGIEGTIVSEFVGVRAQQREGSKSGTHGWLSPVTPLAETAP